MESLVHAVARLGVGYRQASHWDRLGLLTGTGPRLPVGSGNPRMLTASEAATLQYLAWAMADPARRLHPTLASAGRAARLAARITTDPDAEGLVLLVDLVNDRATMIHPADIAHVVTSGRRTAWVIYDPDDED